MAFADNNTVRNTNEFIHRTMRKHALGPIKNSVAEILALDYKGAGYSLRPIDMTELNTVAKMLRIVEQNHLLIIREIRQELSPEILQHQTDDGATLGNRVDEHINQNIAGLKLVGSYVLPEGEQPMTHDVVIILLLVADRIVVFSTKISLLCLKHMALYNRQTMSPKFVTIYKRVLAVINDFQEFVKTLKKGARDKTENFRFYDDNDPFAKRQATIDAHGDFEN